MMQNATHREWPPALEQDETKGPPGDGHDARIKTCKATKEVGKYPDPDHVVKAGCNYQSAVFRRAAPQAESRRAINPSQMNKTLTIEEPAAGRHIAGISGLK
jgi:hypothetical protein